MNFTSSKLAQLVHDLFISLFFENQSCSVCFFEDALDALQLVFLSSCPRVTSRFGSANASGLPRGHDSVLQTWILARMVPEVSDIFVSLLDAGRGRWQWAQRCQGPHGFLWAIVIQKVMVPFRVAICISCCYSWGESCTTWDVCGARNHGMMINHSGAGFLPSTV